MTHKLILASRSPIRAKLLQQSGIEFESVSALVDEEMMKAAMLAEQAPHRDIADKLAEIKALKVSQKNLGRFVLGCDQILSFDGKVFSKPKDQSDLRKQLSVLKSGTHELFSAAVICQDAKPIWRFIGEHIDPALAQMHIALIRVIDKTRMLDQDMIRLQQKVNVVLEYKARQQVLEDAKAKEALQKQMDEEV